MTDLNVEVSCSYCGGEVVCVECGDRPEEVERRWHAIIDTRTRDDIFRQRCPCETAMHSGQWLLCAFHEGFEAGIVLMQDEAERQTRRTA